MKFDRNEVFINIKPSILHRVFVYTITPINRPSHPESITEDDKKNFVLFVD